MVVRSEIPTSQRSKPALLDSDAETANSIFMREPFITFRHHSLPSPEKPRGMHANTYRQMQRRRGQREQLEWAVSGVEGCGGGAACK
jgi:hypothetical protein